MKSKRVYKLLLCLPLVAAAFLTAPRPAHAVITCEKLCDLKTNYCRTHGVSDPDGCNGLYEDCIANCQNPG
jgi:hypothetical protein